jgi:6,7-dimethyl-8-ribityllumazine synthase
MVQSGHKSHAVAGLQFMKPPHVLIVEARFYAHINDFLVAGAEEVLAEAGATFEKVVVPGALEIPAAVSFAAQRTTDRPFDALCCLGLCYSWGYISLRNGLFGECEGAF